MVTITVMTEQLGRLGETWLVFHNCLVQLKLVRKNHHWAGLMTLVGT